MLRCRKLFLGAEREAAEFVDPLRPGEFCESAEYCKQAHFYKRQVANDSKNRESDRTEGRADEQISEKDDCSKKQSFSD